MEWVETTAKSIDEAKELALDKLGVDETETEFEVLEEPKQGLFGRVRGQARVRARVAPKAPRAKDEGRDRKRRPKNRGGQKRNDGSRGGDKSAATAAGDGDNRGSATSNGGGNDRPNNRSQSNKSEKQSTNRSGGRKKAPRQDVEDSPIEDVTAGVESFLTGLTAAFGIETTVSSDVDGEHLMAKIDGKHGLLLGPKARTLDAIQELTRVTAQRSTPSGTRIRVDVGGYREARKQALAGFATQAAERAIAEGVEVVLEPMNSADRKVVHDALNEVDGVGTRSAGNDPNRRVVVVPEVEADDGDAPEDTETNND